MNRTIKEATVKRFHYDDHRQFETYLADFGAVYNFGRRLKTLGGLAFATGTATGVCFALASLLWAVGDVAIGALDPPEIARGRARHRHRHELGASVLAASDLETLRDPTDPEMPGAS